MCGALAISSHRSAVRRMVASCDSTHALVLADLPSRCRFRRWICRSPISFSRSVPRDGYPDSNFVEGIHDPGQAWNALTVGA